MNKGFKIHVTPIEIDGISTVGLMSAFFEDADCPPILWTPLANDLHSLQKHFAPRLALLVSGFGEGQLIHGSLLNGVNLARMIPILCRFCSGSLPQGNSSTSPPAQPEQAGQRRQHEQARRGQRHRLHQPAASGCRRIQQRPFRNLGIDFIHLHSGERRGRQTKIMHYRSRTVDDIACGGFMRARART